MGLVTDGTKYGVPEGIVYSFPVTISSKGEVTIVEGLSISDFATEKMEKTAKELCDERDLTMQFLAGEGNGKL